MANDYVALATLTLTSPDNSITISNIPATYRDLVFIVTHKVDSAAQAEDWYFRFNGDAGSNYSFVRMFGNGSNAFSTSGSGTYANNFIDDTTNFSNYVIQIMDYSATDKHKTFLVRENLATFQVNARAGRWASTAAINSISITSADFGADNFSVGSTFSLYGIRS